MLWNGVTVRHILLTVAALAVLGLGIYLFFEVRATPATADVSRPVVKPVRDDAPEAEPVRDTAPSQVSIPKRGTESPRNPQPARTPTPTPAADVAKPTGTEILKLDGLMSEASKAYDKGDLDEAKTIATKALTLEPNNVRMLRVMVSASCIDGNSIEAQKHYLLLPQADREQMKTRCDRYGVTFNEK
jgi:hypothetical protein